MEEKSEGAPQAIKSVYDRMREKALATRVRWEKIEFDGETYLVRQPSGALIERCQGLTQLKAGVKCIIECTYYPNEKGEPVSALFNAADEATFMEMANTDPLLMALGGALKKLNEGKEERAKNS